MAYNHLKVAHHAVATKLGIPAATVAAATVDQMYRPVALSALTGSHVEVADASGHVWRMQDLHATTIIVVTFTMLCTAVAGALALGCREVAAFLARADEVIQ